MVTKYMRREIYCHRPRSVHSAVASGTPRVGLSGLLLARPLTPSSLDAPGGVVARPRRPAAVSALLEVTPDSNHRHTPLLRPDGHTLRGRHSSPQLTSSQTDSSGKVTRAPRAVGEPRAPFAPFTPPIRVSCLSSAAPLSLGRARRWWPREVKEEGHPAGWDASLEIQRGALPERQGDAGGRGSM